MRAEEGEEVLHRKIEIERRAFGEIAQAQVGRSCGPTGSIDAVDPRIAFIRLKKARDHPQRRGLPGPVGTQEGDRLAPRHG